MGETLKEVNAKRSFIKRVSARLKSKKIRELERRICENEKRTGELFEALQKEEDKKYMLLVNRINKLNAAANYLLYKAELERFPADRDYMPKVSLIMPVYNGEKHLQDALECAFNQTYKNIEIIAVNDGSTDTTDEILTRFSDRITYIKKENGGVSSALNAGINAMTGEYFAWLSHDDMIDNDHIERLVEYVKHHKGEKVIPYSAFKFIDEKGKLLTTETALGNLYLFDYKTSSANRYAPLLFEEINGGSVLIPKQAFTSHGLFDENLRITQERDMWARLIKDYKFVCIPYDTASIRIHGGQVSSAKEEVARKSNEKKIQIAEQICELLKTEHPAKAEELPAYLSMHCFCNTNPVLQEKMQEMYDRIKGE